LGNQKIPFLGPPDRGYQQLVSLPQITMSQISFFMFLYVMILMRNVLCFQVGLQLLRPGSEEILLGAC